jgi:hypothetical protein
VSLDAPHTRCPCVTISEPVSTRSRRVHVGVSTAPVTPQRATVSPCRSRDVAVWRREVAWTGARQGPPLCRGEGCDERTEIYKNIRRIQPLRRAAVESKRKPTCESRAAPDGSSLRSRRARCFLLLQLGHAPPSTDGDDEFAAVSRMSHAPPSHERRANTGWNLRQQLLRSAVAQHQRGMPARRGSRKRRVERIQRSS